MTVDGFLDWTSAMSCWLYYRLSWYQRAAVNRGVTSVSGSHRRDVIVGRATAGDDVTSHVTLSRAVHRSRPASPPECTASSRGLSAQHAAFASFRTAASFLRYFGNWYTICDDPLTVTIQHGSLLPTYTLAGEEQVLFQRRLSVCLCVRPRKTEKNYRSEIDET